MAVFVSGRPHALERRRNDAGLIKNKHITGGQESRQITHGRVYKTTVTKHDEQPRCVLRVDWAQSNLVFRQIEIKS